MINKNIFIVVAILIGAIVTFYFQNSNNNTESDYIDSNIFNQELSSIIVIDKNVETTLINDGQGYWSLDEEDSFIVDGAKIYNLLNSIAQAKIIRKIGQMQQDDFSEYGLDDSSLPYDNDTTIIKTTLASSNDQKIYIYGKNNISSSSSGRFYRDGNSQEIFLVSFGPTIVTPTSWYANKIVNWDIQKINEIDIVNESGINYIKDSTNNDWFSQNKKIEDQNQIDKINAIQQFLNPLLYNEFKVSEKKYNKPQHTIKIRTLNNEELVIELSDDKDHLFGEEDSKIMKVKINNPSAGDKKVNQYLSGKIFNISKYEFDNLKLDDIK